MSRQNDYHSDYYDDVEKGEKRAKKIEQGIFFLLVLVIVVIFALILMM